MAGAGRHGEAPVEIVSESGEIAIGLIRIGDAFQAQLLDQTVLQGLVGAFDPPFGLGRVGTQDLDVEILHGTPKLGQATAQT